MSKKLIIFDMDGTLVNSSVTIANAINFVRKNLGFEAMDQEKILKMVNDHTLNPAQTFYHAKSFDKDHERWFSEYYSKNHGKELVLYSGIKDLIVNLKEIVLDPQGETILHSLNEMGYDEIKKVRQGKIFFVEIDESDEEKGRQKLEEIAHKVLSNPVIETYVIEIEK